MSHCEELDLVFDFAEKVLLPHLLHQPGQLHSVTGLKVDLFAVHRSTKGRTNVFCLPVGHWPGGKTTEEVLSMVYHPICILRSDGGFHSCRCLDPHVDNCGGQNKNRFVLWFFCLLVILVEFDSIVLHFLIIGHTKNGCDAASGFVKRKLVCSDVLCPADMTDVILESSVENDAISSSEVRFLRWKEILGRWFVYPTAMQLTKQHWFVFSAESVGRVQVKTFRASAEGSSYCLLKAEVHVDQVRSEARALLATDDFVSSVTLLELCLSEDNNRRNYLMKGVCERYYANGESFSSCYFSSVPTSAASKLVHLGKCSNFV